MARCDNAVLTFLELGIQCGCAHRQASECDGVGNLELTLGVGLILPGSRAYSDGELVWLLDRAAAPETVS